MIYIKLPAENGSNILLFFLARWWWGQWNNHRRFVRLLWLVRRLLWDYSLTPAMSSTRRVLRVLATWAAMVVPNAMGPEGMRLGGPSLAPVGVNKHKLYWNARVREMQMEKQEVKRQPLNARVRAKRSVNIIRAYIVAFSQEVKCKAVCFSCCRKNRYSRWNIKHSQRGQFK